jgi:ADP-heptose:LPS heptosyltransferase
LFKKILLIKLINFLSNFKKKKINKTLFVSIAGIGDLFLSIPLIKNISILDGDKIDILINENALSIVNKLDYIANIYYITSNGTILCNNKLTNMNFNSYSLIYSNRISNQILAYLFYKGTFIKIIPNPLYEKLRLFSRFYSKISNSYRKNFYSKFHILDLNKKI